MEVQLRVAINDTLEGACIKRRNIILRFLAVAQHDYCFRLLSDRHLSCCECQFHNRRDMGDKDVFGFNSEFIFQGIDSALKNLAGYLTVVIGNNDSDRCTF